jgi:hypothetical protein
MDKIPLEEVWKFIIGFEGKYKISNLGKVKSLTRYKVRNERILNQRDNGVGYLMVSLSLNGKMYYKTVHRLVAEAFIPNPENFDTVDHINGIKHCNYMNNLQWMTNLSNWKKSNMGENNPKSKMTKVKVKEMRNLYKLGNISYQRLGEKFGISKAQVCVIIN